MFATVSTSPSVHQSETLFIKWFAGPIGETRAVRALWIVNRVLNLALIAITCLGASGVLPLTIACCVGTFLSIASSLCLCIKIKLKKQALTGSDLIYLLINIGSSIVTVTFSLLALSYSIAPWAISALAIQAFPGTYETGILMGKACFKGCST